MIKFNSFGVPYLPEFENVSFLPRKNASPSSSMSSFCYVESPPPKPRFSLPSLFKRKTAPTTTVPDDLKPLPPQPDASHLDGIYIQSPPQHSNASRKQRLVHLQQTISLAVLDAGMSSSPRNTALSSIDHTAPQSRGHRKTPDALFCGTYGQLMAAFEAAGLSAIPCAGDGLPGYTRLGALFVARNCGTSGVQLRKITLWG